MRQEAAEQAFARLGQPRRVANPEPALVWPRFDVRRISPWLPCVCAEREDMTRLLVLLRHTNGWVRINAAKAIGWLGDTRHLASRGNAGRHRQQRGARRPAARGDDASVRHGAAGGSRRVAAAGPRAGAESSASQQRAQPSSNRKSRRAAPHASSARTSMRCCSSKATMIYRTRHRRWSRRTVGGRLTL